LGFPAQGSGAGVVEVVGVVQAPFWQVAPAPHSVDVQQFVPGMHLPLHFFVPPLHFFFFFFFFLASVSATPATLPMPSTPSTLRLRRRVR
jgi:hypothetical protein